MKEHKKDHAKEKTMTKQTSAKTDPTQRTKPTTSLFQPAKEWRPVESVEIPEAEHNPCTPQSIKSCIPHAALKVVHAAVAKWSCSCNAWKFRGIQNKRVRREGSSCLRRACLQASLSRFFLYLLILDLLGPRPDQMK